MPTRQAIVSRAVKANRPRTGGTSAPASAAGGPYIAPNHGFQMGLGPAKPVVPIYGKGQTLGGPTAPAPPAGREPTPWDSAYEHSVGNANKKYLDTSRNLDLAQTATEQDFGLAPNYNDYKSNPYSRAALLQQSYLQGNRGVMNNAGLQLYSGSTGNRLAANRAGYGQNTDQLEKTYRDAIGAIRDKRVEAAGTKGDEEVEADWNRISNAEKAPLDPTQAPVGKTKKHKRRNRKGK